MRYRVNLDEDGSPGLDQGLGRGGSRRGERANNGETYCEDG